LSIRAFVPNRPIVLKAQRIRKVLQTPVRPPAGNGFFAQQSNIGWATLFCPPFLSANGGQTIKLFAHPTKLDA
jgi:hypothetical protein